MEVVGEPLSAKDQLSSPLSAPPLAMSALVSRSETVVQFDVNTLTVLIYFVLLWFLKGTKSIRKKWCTRRNLNDKLCYKCILTPLHHCSKAHILTTASWDHLGGKSLRVPVTADGMCYSTRTESPMCFTCCWLSEINSLLPLGFLCHIFQPDTAPKRISSPHHAILLCGVNWHVVTL